VIPGTVELPIACWFVSLNNETGHLFSVDISFLYVLQAFVKNCEVQRS
jgi:hypothetical protein